MKAIEIENLKKITTEMFAQETFDSFCVTEAKFSTFVNIEIDGHTNEDFYKSPDGKGEPVQVEPIIKWKQIRPLCFEAIKGKRLPLKFKIVFMTPPEKVAGFIEKQNLNFKPSDVAGLFMNIRFENGKMQCTSGVSLKSFSLDKSLEEAWDRSVESFMKKYV